MGKIACGNYIPVGRGCAVLRYLCMHLVVLWVWAALIFAHVIIPGRAAHAADIFLTGGGGEYFGIRVSSFADIPFKGIIRQGFDYSCGSAALATMLSYHYETPVSEIKVLKQMYEHGDKDKIRKEGFSLLDMKRYLAAIGLRADGFRESLDKLERVGIPAIVLLNINGYLHFVVVKGVRDDQVLVGDPALGMKVIARNEFEQMWNGIIFVITSRMQVARKYFNNEKYWSFRPRSPFSPDLQKVRHHELGELTLDMVRTPGYF